MSIFRMTASSPAGRSKSSPMARIIDRASVGPTSDIFGPGIPAIVSRNWRTSARTKGSSMGVDRQSVRRCGLLPPDKTAWQRAGRDPVTIDDLAIDDGRDEAVRLLRQAKA